MISKKRGRYTTRDMADELGSLEEKLKACCEGLSGSVQLCRWEAQELLWLLQERRKELWNMNKEM